MESISISLKSKELNFYKEIKVFGWDDLSKNKQEQINTFINKGQKRLFGYASWKPEIILSYLNKIPTNSILQYSDIGCFFNPKGIKRLNDYVKIAQEKDFLAFKYIEPDFDHKKNFKFQVYYEYQYTKADAWTYLNIEENSPILQSEQIWSGTMFFKNNSYAKNLLNNWMEACDNNNLIDDSDSIYKNHKEFYENGDVLAEASFKDDKKNGKLIHYSETGDITLEGNFIMGDGKLIGYRNGKIISETNILNGEIVDTKRY